MKYINYTFKNEEGKIIAVRYFPNDNELSDLNKIMFGPRKPSEISFRGQILKTRNIEVLDESGRMTGDSEKYDLRDPNKKEEVRAFEREILFFFQNQPETERTFEHYLIAEKVIKVKNVEIKSSGFERFNPCDITILKPMEFGILSARWSALNLLRWMRVEAERHEREDLEILAG